MTEDRGQRTEGQKGRGPEVPELTTLGELARACGRGIGIGTSDVAHPCCTEQAGARAEQERVVGLACRYAVVQFARENTPRRRDIDRLERRVKRHIREQRAGFAPLVWVVGPLLSWVVSRALEWLWTWWRRSPPAQRTEVLARLAQAALAELPCCGESLT